MDQDRQARAEAARAVLDEGLEQGSKEIPNIQAMQNIYKLTDRTTSEWSNPK